MLYYICFFVMQRLCEIEAIIMTKNTSSVATVQYLGISPGPKYLEKVQCAPNFTKTVIVAVRWQGRPGAISVDFCAK